MTSSGGNLRADAVVTRERLLAASLRLFSERGYEGTSMRAITDAAGVNLAAANYHFGSKQQLLQATFQTALAPINAERLRRLEALENSTTPLELAPLVRAFVEPFFFSGQREYLPKLVASLLAGSKEVARPLLESTFSATVDRFVGSLRVLLPEADVSTLHWRLHFVVGAMLQLAHFNEPLLLPAVKKKSKRTDLDRGTHTGVEELVGFAVAGLQQELVKQAQK